MIEFLLVLGSVLLLPLIIMILVHFSTRKDHDLDTTPPPLQVMLPEPGQYSACATPREADLLRRSWDRLPQNVKTAWIARFDTYNVVYNQSPGPSYGMPVHDWIEHCSLCGDHHELVH